MNKYYMYVSVSDCVHAIELSRAQVLFLYNVAPNHCAGNDYDFGYSEEWLKNLHKIFRLADDGMILKIPLHMHDLLAYNYKSYIYIYI